MNLIWKSSSAVTAQARAENPPQNCSIKGREAINVHSANAASNHTHGATAKKRVDDKSFAEYIWGKMVACMFFSSPATGDLYTAEESRGLDGGHWLWRSKLSSL